MGAQGMILIAHRGNFNGPNLEKENKITYIEEAIDNGYEVEIDVRMHKNTIYTGHDKPLDLISCSWLKRFNDKLWIHCKDAETLKYFADLNLCNYFWHENDSFTITSKGFILSHVNNNIKKLSGQFIKINLDNKKIHGNFVGILSDYLIKYT
jgi:hypothetical protein